ncbi:helix-turn-helix domain-containing protein [Halomonas sp. HK25]|uniref:helix-turn-helix domain-containing protein n=1 Tax=Halomonas sp. HK25 TaxID=3394321 RepID=UPI0039FC7AAE
MSAKHLSPQELSECRLQAVRLRLDGHTVAETARRTGLSAPTVSAAWKAFLEGGWEAVPVRVRGRKAGQAERLSRQAQQALARCLAAQPAGDEPAWSSRALAEVLKAEGYTVSPRAVDHWLEARDLKPEPLVLEGLERRRSTAGRWYRQQVQPVLEEVRRAHGDIWQGGVRVSRPGDQVVDEPRRYQLYLHGKRGVLLSRCFASPPVADDYLALFQRLPAQANAPVALVFHGAHFQACSQIRQWLDTHTEFHLINVPAGLRSAPEAKQKER